VFHSIEQQLSRAFHAHIQARYGIDLTIGIEQPRQSDFGELAIPEPHPRTDAFRVSDRYARCCKELSEMLAAGSDEGGGARPPLR
jgi:hypothetical protein